MCESPLDWPGVHAAKALVHGEPLEGYWFNRSKAWSAVNRGLDVGRYDFATRYLVRFAQLPAFRHLSPEAYRDKVASLIREIEDEGEKQRGGNEVAGVEKILSQNPFEPPTRQTKRSSKPLFHVASRQARDDLRGEFGAFLAQYWEASEALRAGNLKAAAWFPEGCYPPALSFIGPPLISRPPAPPTRRITIMESGGVERGGIPVVEIPVTIGIVRPQTVESRAVELRTRGQPP